MAKQSKNVDNPYVRKETLYLVSLLALAVGFFGGVMFAVYKSDSTPAPGTSMGPAPQAQAPQPQAADPGRLSMIAELEKETQANPGNEKAWIELGNAYFDTGQHEKSIQAYRRALEINPNNANVWTDMGVMYRRSGNPQEAIKSFDKAAEVDPKHEISRMNKGIVLLHDMNDMEGAIKAWEELLEINPVAVSPTGQSIDQMVQQMKKQPQQQGPAN
jgi:cytochrome c-type biogenesis protein CcmH/NrfG